MSSEAKQQKVSPSQLLTDRAMGCLIGQCVGDALGTRYEFGKSATVKKQITKDTIDGHLPILGGGPFHLAKGSITDDSELALALANSLANKKSFSIYNIAQIYTIWFHSPPFDIGVTTATAFKSTDPKKSEEKNYEQILMNSAKDNQNSLSNGCLMRTSPLAIAGARWNLENLQMAAKMDCELTNPNPVALDAVSVYVTAIRTAILTGDRLQTYKAALEAATTEEIRNLLIAAADKPEPIILNNGKSVSTDSQFQGYLGVALQNTFHELLKSNTGDFEKSLVNIISRGGDTDTNGCIAGALLGAVDGFTNIPFDWAETVLNAKPEERLKEYPLADTSNLLELALILFGTDKSGIQEPIFKDDFIEINENEEEGERDYDYEYEDDIDDNGNEYTD